MSWNVLRLRIGVEFPSGASPGAGRDGNAAFLARDGRGSPVLRGSALAGVLRRALQRAHGRPDADLAHWFGHADGASGAGVASRIVVHDVPIDCGTQPQHVEVRTHNAIDRHTGAPVPRGLFSLESVPPGARGTVLLTLRAAEAEVAEATEMLREIAGAVEAGLHVGGGAARGIGLMRARPKELSFRRFDLANLDDHARWLDEQHARRSTLRSTALEGGPLEGGPLEGRSTRNLLVVRAQLRVPRGQDVLVGGDSGLDARIEPQQVAAADGTPHLRFPGSSFRGILRKWVARLAAREGLPVADSHARAVARRERGDEADGAGLGYGFEPKARQAELAADPDQVACPVMRLFGSLYAKGRCRVSDALVPASGFDVQRRTHVSIDRFAGGASNSFLFDTTVVAAPASAPQIPLRIEIEDPTEQEAQWILHALRAIDLGILRIGSSKGAGRLGIGSIDASGPHAGTFASMGAKGDDRHG